MNKKAVVFIIGGIGFIGAELISKKIRIDKMEKLITVSREHSVAIRKIGDKLLVYMSTLADIEKEFVTNEKQMYSKAEVLEIIRGHCQKAKCKSEEIGPLI